MKCHVYSLLKISYNGFFGVGKHRLLFQKFGKGLFANLSKEIGGFPHSLCTYSIPKLIQYALSKITVV